MPDSGDPAPAAGVRLLPQRFEPLVPLGRLHPHPANFNQGDLGLLDTLLDSNGFAGAVMAQESTGILIDGKTRYLAARDKHMPGLPVLWVDCTDDERDRFLASWNESGRRGMNDDAALLAFLRGMAGTARGLDGCAFTGDTIDELEQRLNAGPYPGDGGTGDDGDLPDPPAQPVTRRGDLWLMWDPDRGLDHRLLCGDAASPADLATLMDAGTAGCLWTDPPHGSDIVGGFRGTDKDKRRAAGSLTLDGDDDAADLAWLLQAAWANAGAVLRPGAPLYVCYSAGPPWNLPQRAFRGAGWLLRETLIWVKDTFVVSNLDYHPQYEPILYGFTPGGTGKLGRRGPNWHGDNSAANVFTFPRPRRSDEHPTRKPAGLIAAHLANSAAPGDLVLDVFAGSGPVLAACHHLGLAARLLEISPAFCDVICARWQALTGSRPVLAATHQAIDFTPAPAPA